MTRLHLVGASSRNFSRVTQLDLAGCRSSEGLHFLQRAIPCSGYRVLCLLSLFPLMIALITLLHLTLGERSFDEVLHNAIL